MNYSQILKTLYPDGTKQGQCAVFTEKITDMPLVGFFTWTKRQAIAKYGISRSQMGALQVGDVIITSDGLVGHTAFINNKPTSTSSQLSESNWNLDGRVHHNRIIQDSYPNIIGVFRNCKIKFPVPATLQPPLYNIHARVKLIMNNQPEWNSLTAHMYNATEWIYKNSGAHILPVIDPIYTNLSGWSVKQQPDSFGNNIVPVMDEAWFDQNVLPLAKGFDIVIFCMPKKDWNGHLINDPNNYELGYCFPGSTTTPIKITIGIDENDDYAPYYPSIGGFAKYLVHEMDHGFYHIGANSTVVPGGDYTHNHFYGLNGQPMVPEDCFEDYDYQKLSSLIKP